MAAGEAPPAGLLTIAEAADRFGVTPWDVVRLIEAERVETVTLVSVDSLTREIA